MENYPIYFITISDNADGIEAISLVEEPATGEQKVYVLESDITSTQNKVQTVESETTF